MEIYGESGYVITVNNSLMRMRKTGMDAEHTSNVTSKDIPVYEDPFSYFADVIKQKIHMKPSEPYSLENNIMVVKILSAARESAATGKTIMIK
jgi:predicted dehydrogenase